MLLERSVVAVGDLRVRLLTAAASSDEDKICDLFGGNVMTAGSLRSRCRAPWKVPT